MAKVVRRIVKGANRQSVPNKKPVSKTFSNAGRSPNAFTPPLAMALYGPGGVGKTSFLAQFPRPGFLHHKDEGITDLVQYGLVKSPESRGGFVKRVNDWSELRTALADVVSENSCDTLIIDNLTDVEYLCFQYHCTEYFDGDWSKQGFYNYYQGPRNAAKTDWPDFLSDLGDVLQAGISVILVAHSRTKAVSNPAGGDYLRWEPVLDEKIWDLTHYWCKATIFYSLHVELETDKKKLTPGKTKAKGDYSRIMFTEPAPIYEAKNRYGLPPVIDAGDSPEEAFKNFVESFKKR